MTRYTTAQTTDWVAGNLRENNLIFQVDVLADQVLRIVRSKYAPFVAGIISETRVETNAIGPLIKSNLDVEIIANVPSESIWTGDALRLAQENNIATGAFGDLYRVLDLENVRTFQSKETAFIERGLRQHDRITRFELICDRLYRISRMGLPDLIVAMLNHYESTADHLRTARDRYGNFSVAVNTNPNGSTTSSAAEAAQTMGIEILNWRSFFGHLNKK